MSDASAHPILHWLIAHRRWLLYLGLVLAVAGAYVGRDLQLDRSIERMFADDDPVLEPYRKLRETFGRHEIVLAIYSEPELTSSSGKERLAKVTEQVRGIPGVVSVVSLLDPPAAADFDEDPRGTRFRKIFAGYTHNATLDLVGIVCLLQQEESGTDAFRHTLDRLHAIIDPLPNGTLVGESLMVQEAFDLLDADGKRLSTWCTLLLLLVIFMCFRELRWLVLPLVVVQMALALTRGLLVAFNLQMTMVSSMLAAIVTVVGVATVVHVIVRYRDGLAQGRTSTESLLWAGQILGWPILFACLTDAGGFAALMVSSVGPVQDFGLMMSIGTLMVLVSAGLVLPGIVLMGPSSSAKEPTFGELALRQSLGRLLTWSRRHAKGLYAFGVIATLVAVFGCPKLVLETDFTRNFRHDSTLVRDYQFVEEHFGGAGVWDILVPAPVQLNKPFLMEVLALEESLRNEIAHVNSSLSIAAILDAGTAGLDQLRFGAKLAIRGGLALMRARMPDFVELIYHPRTTETDGFVRIMLRSPERLGAAEKTQVIEQVQSTAQKAFSEAEVTGYYVLLTQLIESLLRDQWTTFAVAGVAIFLMMALGFRSLTLALATLIPNALPVLWLFGAMGIWGIRVNMGAAMIAAVSLGLSVDGSIHYVMTYQRERRAGARVETALERVQATVGRAAVFATLALIVGFATLCISDFVPTIYFGALVSLSMIGGLAGNLIVLPLLIRLVDRSDETKQERIGPPPSHLVDAQPEAAEADRSKV